MRSGSVYEGWPRGVLRPILLKTSIEYGIFVCVKCLILQCIDGALRDDGTTRWRAGSVVLLLHGRGLSHCHKVLDKKLLLRRLPIECRLLHGSRDLMGSGSGRREPAFWAPLLS